MAALPRVPRHFWHGELEYGEAFRLGEPYRLPIRAIKVLYSGSGSVLTFQLEALQDGPVELKDATGWLVGPQGDFVESDLLAKGELPEVPQTSVHELGQQDFDISITNKALAEGRRFECLADDSGR